MAHRLQVYPQLILEEIPAGEAAKRTVRETRPQVREERARSARTLHPLWTLAYKFKTLFHGALHIKHHFIVCPYIKHHVMVRPYIKHHLMVRPHLY